MYLHRVLGRPNQRRKLIQYTCQQDWDSSLVKTFKMKKREKRVCMVLFTFGFVCVCVCFYLVAIKEFPPEMLPLCCIPDMLL